MLQSSSPRSGRDGTLTKSCILPAADPRASLTRPAPWTDLAGPSWGPSWGPPRALALLFNSETPPLRDVMSQSGPSPRWHARGWWRCEVRNASLGEAGGGEVAQVGPGLGTGTCGTSNSRHAFLNAPTQRQRSLIVLCANPQQLSLSPQSLARVSQALSQHTS